MEEIIWQDDQHGVFTDPRDNIKYNVVKISDKIWMAENLNASHYRNGDPIPQVQDSSEWNNLITGAWCYYDSNSKNGQIYGKLYNWIAVADPRGLPPEGWHIPNEIDWQYSNDSEWLSLQKFQQFSGYRDKNAQFSQIGYKSNLWLSTSHQNQISANYKIIEKGFSSIMGGVTSKKCGHSVRCVKNN